MKRLDLTGIRSGHIVAISYHSKTGNGGCKWNVKCDCGNEFVVWAEQITRRRTKQCRQCRNKVISEIRTSHGHRSNQPTQTYRSWNSAKTRCENPNCECYHLYGGRGIKVCDRWTHSFENFLIDMGECPPGMSLERKDVNGNYEPSNCKWATCEEQGNNRRTNKTLTFNGKTQTWSQWSRETGIDKTLIRQRANKGWPVEKVLSKEKFFAGARNFYAKL